MCSGREPKRQAGVAKTRKGKEAAGDEEMEGGRESEDGFCGGDSSDGWLWRRRQTRTMRARRRRNGSCPSAGFNLCGLGREGGIEPHF